MIRKVYVDFVKRKAAAGNLGWLLGIGGQYLLTRLSFTLRRPLCGPILGTLVTNYTCNLSCRMCRMPQSAAAFRREGLRELATAEMLTIIDDFAAVGTRGIGFTGGEPLLRPDIFELLRRTRQRGMFAHLNTNGTLLDERKVRSLLDAGVESLNISLDGATAATHDGIRGVAGAFDKTVGAVRLVDRIRKERSAPLRLKVVAVLSEQNAGEVEAYLRLAAALGVDCAEFIPRQSFPEGPGRGAPADTALAAKVADAVSILRRRDLPVAVEDSPGMLSLFAPSFRGDPSPLTCFAGYNSLAVDCYGAIFPCVPYVNWGRSVGNISRTPLRSFWFSRDYARERETIARCRSCTLNCQAELNLLFQPLRRL